MAGFLVAGSSGAAAALGAMGPMRIAIERDRAAAAVAHRHEPGVLCAGGLDELAQIEIVPDAFVEEGGRERVEYHSEITVQRGDGVGLAWNADVVDDRGATVVARLDAGAVGGRAGQVAFTGPLIARLADGFYALRVRVAVTAADEPATVIEAVQRVAVESGRWIELTDEQWFERSRANEAFTEAELVTRGL
jgi:hypothetical protein